jgi:hypothetical protein
MDRWLSATNSIVAAISSYPLNSPCSNLSTLSAAFRIFDDAGSGTGALCVHTAFVPFNCAAITVSDFHFIGKRSELCIRIHFTSVLCADVVHRTVSLSSRNRRGRLILLQTWYSDNAWNVWLPFRGGRRKFLLFFHYPLSCRMISFACANLRGRMGALSFRRVRAE